MFAFLLTALLFSGFSVYLSLIPPVQGESCRHRIRQGCSYGAGRIRNSQDVDTICSSQTQRRNCYNNAREDCPEDLVFKGMLAKYDYICSVDVKSRFKTILDDCIEGKAAAIRRKVQQACTRVNETSSCADITRFMHCLTQVMDDCCPSVCNIQYNSLKLYFDPILNNKQCTQPTPFILQFSVMQTLSVHIPLGVGLLLLSCLLLSAQADPAAPAAAAAPADVADVADAYNNDVQGLTGLAVEKRDFWDDLRFVLKKWWDCGSLIRFFANKQKCMYGD